MLNFRNTNIFFIILMVISFGMKLFVDVPFILYPALVLIYSGIVFYGCYYVHSAFFLPVICSAETSAMEIAISFDDGPSNNFTPSVLQLLKEQDVEAAFFCIGNRIAGNEILLQKIQQEGHIIGNHSYSHHRCFDLFSAKKMIADLKMMDQETERVTGLQPKLFRPPYGVTNPNVKKAVVKGGYIPVGWSVRSMDTVIRDETYLLNKINKAVKPGAIFLFHDTSKTTLAVLTAFIQKVKGSGYKIVRLDKLLHLKPYA